MKYKKVKINTYNLHMIKTNKFKTITFKILFRDEINKDMITIRNLLVDNLIFSNKKYPTKKEMAIKKQELYGANLNGYNKRIGNHLLTEIALSILNPKYTEENMLEKSISFFNDIIFKPNVQDGKFNKEIFDIIKKNNEADIKSLKEDSNEYAITRLKENMDDTNPFSFRITGYLEDLKKINESKLYDYYLDIIESSLIDFYVVGDISFKEIETAIKDTFKFKSNKSIKKEITINYENKRDKEQMIIEDSEFNQSVIAVGCSLKELSDKERKYIGTIFNIILGNSPESKFFKNIREKNSYAYSISSSFRRADDMLLINGGISYKNYEDVIRLIKENLIEMINGNFTAKDINSAKELFISVLNDVEEYPNSIADYYFSLTYLKTDPLKDQINNIRSISKKEIINVAKKILIDTIYILKEGK